MALAIAIPQGDLSFAGPFTSVAGLMQRSGVYVITTIVNGLHYVVDVGESHNIQHRVSTHDRSSLWNGHVGDRLYVSALYCDEPSRMAVERAVRGSYNPPCGDR